eukprot:EG_transcript_40070
MPCHVWVVGHVQPEEGGSASAGLALHDVRLTSKRPQPPASASDPRGTLCAELALVPHDTVVVPGDPVYVLLRYAEPGFGTPVGYLDPDTAEARYREAEEEAWRITVPEVRQREGQRCAVVKAHPRHHAVVV